MNLSRGRDAGSTPRSRRRNVSASAGVRPAVSAIVLAHQSSAGLAVTLDSIAAQTFADHEVIVVGGALPDTYDVQAVRPPLARRVRYLAERYDATIGAARNAGIIASQGRFVAFLNAGDRWRRDFLDRQVAYLEADPACGLVCADAATGGEWPPASPRIRDGAVGAVTLLSLVQQQRDIVLPTIVARREPLFDAGLFDETLRSDEDADLWLRLAFRGVRMRYLPGVLATCRTCADTPADDAVLRVERSLNVLDRFGRAHRLDAATRTALRIRTMVLVDRLEIEQAKLRFAEGNFAAARYHLSAARERPFTRRLALLALRVAPALARSAYLRLRPWRARPAAAVVP